MIRLGDRSGESVSKKEAFRFDPFPSKSQSVGIKKFSPFSSEQKRIKVYTLSTLSIESKISNEIK